MTAIVLTNSNWGIAKNGIQPLYIKEDLARFRMRTLGQTIIYGRKTLTTFPDGLPLKGRTNICLSKTMEYADGLTIYKDISAIPKNILESAICIGGASVYKQLLPYFTDVYQTLVLEPDFDADLYFPALDKDQKWYCTSTRYFDNTNYVYKHWRKSYV